MNIICYLVIFCNTSREKQSFKKVLFAVVNIVNRPTDLNT